jgi:hypothetical protein
MLAIAAAIALNTSPETYREAIGTLLEKLILHGLVLDRGLQGELCTRLLLMVARDKAVEDDNRQFIMPHPISGVDTVQAVRLSCFLTTLLGPKLGVSSVDQVRLREGLLSRTSRFWINFTHFVHLSKPIDEVTPSMLLEAWSSGFAFQCAFYQEVIDGFFVVYSGELQDSFDIGKLFIIPWQTKARSKAVNTCQLTAPFLVKDGNLPREKPEHIVILMDLAASSCFGSANGPHVELSFDKAMRPTGRQGKWDGYARGNETECARYCLNIRGHGSSVYPVLQNLDVEFDQLFQRSLACVQPQFMRFAEEMEDAMERIKLE